MTSYAVRALEAIGEALSALSSPDGIRVLEGVERTVNQVDAAIGPGPLIITIRTTAGDVTLEFGEGTA